VPQWPAILDAALAAHRAFEEFPSVGWDVAVTTDGIRVIEGNPYWSVHLAQKPSGRPLAAIGYNRILQAHLLASPCGVSRSKRAAAA
jgi:hypothetical protein